MRTAPLMPLRDPYSTDPIPRIPHGDSSAADPHPADQLDPDLLDPGLLDRHDQLLSEAQRQRQDPIRRAVTERLLVAGRRHTRHRTDRAAQPDRPGPHALLILLRQTLPGRTDTVLAATRLFLDGPDVTHLPTLLGTLTDRARDYHQLPLHALIAHLCDRIDPDHRAAAYLGVAVSSIDPSRERQDPMPWDGIAHLVDGTRLALHATAATLPPQIISTHTLNVGTPLFELRPWQWATATPAPTGRADLTDAHIPLAALHHHLQQRPPDHRF